PYSYEVVAAVDPHHPWHLLINSSYELLRWIYDVKQLPVPPETLYLDTARKEILLPNPTQNNAAVFSYDVFPLFCPALPHAAWVGTPDGLAERTVTYGTGCSHSLSENGTSVGSSWTAIRWKELPSRPTRGSRSTPPYMRWPAPRVTTWPVCSAKSNWHRFTQRRWKPNRCRTSCITGSGLIGPSRFSRL